MGNDPGKMMDIHLSEHVKISISDTAQARSNVEKTWRKFYAPWISRYSKDRKKFVTMGSLCNSVKVKKINNIKKEIWLEDNQKQCDSVYVQFDIYIDMKYKKESLNLELSTFFHDKFNLFDDNKFDKYNEYWQQSLIVKDRNIKDLWIPFLNQIISNNEDNNDDNQDKISHIILDYMGSSNDKIENRDREEEEIFVIENGKMNINNCLLMAGILKIENENAEVIKEYFDLLWKWFLSKELITFRKETVDEKMVWRESTNA